MFFFVLFFFLLTQNPDYPNTMLFLFSLNPRKYVQLAEACFQVVSVWNCIPEMAFLKLCLAFQVPMVSAPKEAYSSTPPLYQPPHNSEPRPQTDTIDPLQVTAYTAVVSQMLCVHNGLDMWVM